MIYESVYIVNKIHAKLLCLISELMRYITNNRLNNIIERQAYTMKDIFYRCEKCGNIVALVKSGGGTLVCCGQDMTQLVANTVDASQEKHVPDVKVKGNKIKVQVGSVIHPMVPEHYIEWIALVSDEKVEIKYLKAGMEPVAKFKYIFDEEIEKVPYTDEGNEIPNCEGQPCNFEYPESKVGNVSIYEYCNLHGLWKTDL